MLSFSHEYIKAKRLSLKEQVVIFCYTFHSHLVSVLQRTAAATFLTFNVTMKDWQQHSDSHYVSLTLHFMQLFSLSGSQLGLLCCYIIRRSATLL